jgi:hypothetical protein
VSPAPGQGGAAQRSEPRPERGCDSAGQAGVIGGAMLEKSKVADQLNDARRSSLTLTQRKRGPSMKALQIGSYSVIVLAWLLSAAKGAALSRTKT